jgi:hypothetical protein
LPYDKSRLRLERFQGELSYHAAYNYWNLRGVLAERWAHGPVFGAASALDAFAQTTLTPATGEGGDTRLWAAYGLRASGLLAEGQYWVPQAPRLLERWIGDALDVFQPKRVVRAATSLFALYPVDDITEASTKLRELHQGSTPLQDLFPDSLREHRDSFHSAIDFLVPLDDEGSNVSVVIGAVGPIHKGGFFIEPDEERDNTWWMGIRYDRRRLAEAEGLKEPGLALKRMAQRSMADVEHLAEHALEGVV